MSTGDVQLWFCPSYIYPFLLPVYLLSLRGYREVTPILPITAKDHKITIASAKQWVNQVREIGQGEGITSRSWDIAFRVPK